MQIQRFIGGAANTFNLYRKICVSITLVIVVVRLRPRKDYRALSLFYRIMAEVSRPAISGATAAVRMAIQYIDAHFCDTKLSVEAVASAAGVSESYLYQLFREAGEMSPKEYILDCRIHYACTLLKTHYYKVYEVAEKCGFSGPKYFMTVFKNRMGVSPRQIRHTRYKLKVRTADAFCNASAVLLERYPTL